MIKNNDLYSYILPLELTSNNIVVGYTHIQYEVREYTALTNLDETRKFIVTCTQRLMVASQNTYDPAPGGVTYFNEYPALISNKISFDSKSSTNIDTVELIDYSPRTLNTAVMSSRSDSDAKGIQVSSSKEHTTGSSTSQTNSYGGSVNLSASTSPMGNQYSGGVSGNYEHSSTHSHSQTNSTGSSRSQNQEQNNTSSNSMSLKDWGSYAAVDLKNQTAQWVWGQEYPWNVIQFKNANAKNVVTLPDFIIKRLYDNGMVFPPSELALFGVNFVSKASWLITPKVNNSDLINIIFNHDVQICNASHGLDASHVSEDDKITEAATPNFTATLSVVSPAIQTTPVKLDLDLLALDPINTTGVKNGAVIGFIPDKFSAPPNNNSAFKIVSDANNLLILGSGFNAPMYTDFSGGAAKLTVYFKITDTDLDHTLYMKHWKTTPVASVMSIIVNGNSDTPIVKHIDAKESEGGEMNLLSIVLRNKDYSSDDFYDYLRLGMNILEITITPSDGATGVASQSGYAIRALALG